MSHMGTQIHKIHHSCRNPCFGLATKAKVYKVVGQEWGSGVTSHAPRSAKSAKSAREWTFTLPSELPLWELESKGTLESSKCNCKGQNPSIWRIFNIIAKLLKHGCLKWAHITHLDIWNTSYDQKKGHESNWQFDSRPLKVRDRPNFLAFMWRATYHWKDLDKGYNFASNLIEIGGFHAKLWAPKVARVLAMGISGLPLGSLGTKCHFDMAPVKRCREYYKGEGGGFPQV